MKRLFQTCDGDGDGYINRNDLLMVCRQLNMEESVAEIMGQLGAEDERGKISYEDFARCRMQLVQEIRQEEGELCSQRSLDSETRKQTAEHTASWPNSSDNSLGARESWEYDSGAHDLQSPDIQFQTQPVLTKPLHSGLLFQKLLEQPGTVLERQQALHKLLLGQTSASTVPLGGNYLDLANTSRHTLPFPADHYPRFPP
ncbi:uncharacterized protein FYW47_002191 [Aplochiton taeniatus]